ncbi:MAG: hypothetical protein QOE82_2514, partial [Thermoanaerobaculia bacterium]|nr:hypothetical protein [Thermoanaerobaculia bacterium]
TVRKHGRIHVAQTLLSVLVRLGTAEKSTPSIGEPRARRDYNTPPS